MTVKKIRMRIAAVVMAAAMLTGAAVAGNVQRAEVTKADAQISEMHARNIAVRDARVSTADVEAVEIHEDTVRGQRVYDVSFYAKKAGLVYTHYKYDINVNSGAIVKKNSADKRIISKNTALNKALDKAGVSKGRTTDRSIDLDDEDEMLVYHVSFSVPERYYSYYGFSYTEDDIDYDFTINAITGKVVYWDSDIDSTSYDVYYDDYYYYDVDHSDYYDYDYWVFY